jgi:hypothetical protein
MLRAAGFQLQVHLGPAEAEPGRAPVVADVKDVGPLLRQQGRQGREPWTVRPASASSGVNRNSVHAMLSINKGEVTGEVPGLESVAIAIGTPASRNADTGGSRVSRNA